jgi:hypothetical protein
MSLELSQHFILDKMEKQAILAACIHAYTTAHSSFLVVKLVPGYVNSLTTATLYSPSLTLCTTCLLLFAWIRMFVFDRLSSLLCSDLKKLPGCS